MSPCLCSPSSRISLDLSIQYLLKALKVLGLATIQNIQYCDDMHFFQPPNFEFTPVFQVSPGHKYHIHHYELLGEGYSSVGGLLAWTAESTELDSSTA